MSNDRHTGTFFCDMTTAQLFPRTPTEVMFAAVIALKAYSRIVAHVSAHFDAQMIKSISKHRDKIVDSPTW